MTTPGRSAAPAEEESDAAPKGAQVQGIAGMPGTPTTPGRLLRGIGAVLVDRIMGPSGACVERPWACAIGAGTRARGRASETATGATEAGPTL